MLTFHGSAKDLCHKSVERNYDCRDNSFNQCGDCSGQRAMLPISQIRDTAMVNHAPVGCSGDFSSFNAQFRRGLTYRGLAPRNIQALSTNLTEEDMVFGGAAKLAQTIREAKDRFQPKAIFVTTSCASGIIGDDIEEVVGAAEAELGIPIVPVYCEGFKSRIWTSGFDAAYHAIVRKLVKPPTRTESKVVNIMGFTNSPSFTPFLGLIGLRPRYLVHQASLEDLAQMSEALASSHMCETLGTYLCRALEQEYEVPELKSPPPFGLDWSDRFLRELGRLAGLEKKVEEVIASEREKIAPELEKIKSEVSGLTVFALAGASFGHSLLAIAHDLGLKIVGMTGFHHDQRFDNDYEEINSLKNCINLVGDIRHYSVCNKQPYQLVNILKKAKPDLVLARHEHLPSVAVRLGIPTYFVSDANLQIGYQGLLYTARKILKVLSAKNFVKNLSQHVRLPYTQWWLKTDPFHFKGDDHAFSGS
jgi:nitrogenase molybdenum-iron protein alpha chain